MKKIIYLIIGGIALLLFSIFALGVNTQTQHVGDDIQICLMVMTDYYEINEDGKCILHTHHNSCIPDDGYRKLNDCIEAGGEVDEDEREKETTFFNRISEFLSNFLNGLKNIFTEQTALPGIEEDSERRLKGTNEI